MHTLRSVFRLTLIVGLAAIAGCSKPAAQATADLVLENGSIYTVDDARSWAQAIAISDGRFSYVGTDAGVQAFIGPHTQVVDLGGRMVLPGMFDVHIHALGSGLEALSCDLFAETLDKGVRFIIRKINQTPFPLLR